MEIDQLIILTADIVSAHVSNNSVAIGDVGTLVERVHTALSALAEPEVAAPEPLVPAVSIRASIKSDHLICMACGAKQKTLKRHLMTAHSLTPQTYRDAFGLPADYPMVSAEYSQRRGDMARKFGLGRKRAAKQA